MGVSNQPYNPTYLVLVRTEYKAKGASERVWTFWGRDKYPALEANGTTISRLHTRALTNTLITSR